MSDRFSAFAVGVLVGTLLGFMLLRSMLAPVERCIITGPEGTTICTGRATPPSTTVTEEE